MDVETAVFHTVENARRDKEAKGDGNEQIEWVVRSLLQGWMRYNGGFAGLVISHSAR